jgi:hypothetical protein
MEGRKWSAVAVHPPSFFIFIFFVDDMVYMWQTYMT